MRKTVIVFILGVLFILNGTSSYAQQKPLSQRMAATVMDIWADSLWTGRPFKWTYDQGTLLEGISNIWQRTADPAYFNYIRKSMDFFVTDSGDIRTYDHQSHNIDNIKNGRALLLLYRVTQKNKYFKAATLLRNQLNVQPRTKEGGFWHKQIYPWQMWLDGLYMGQPFYAEYASLAADQAAFDDVTKQFVLMEKHSRDPKTGLMYHGYDESREQQWANKADGRSPHVWGRAMGWYGMALVDALPSFPKDHPGRQELIAILNRFAAAIVKVQDAKTGVWKDILDAPYINRKENYFEASASSMFTYALAKGVRLGYLPASYLKSAQKAWSGMQREFVEENGPDKINLKGTVSVSGLGGKPYRDGSFEYYMKEKVIVNDPKGVGAFMCAANEMEIAAEPKPGAGKKVTLDYYFNNERRHGALGQPERYHYNWEDQANSGFWLWGNLFSYRGAQLNSLEAAPTASNLKGSDVYIIVDPDTEKESAKPNFVAPKDIDEVEKWVKAGGVLVLMSNDFGNCEFTHFNKLAERFGIHFNEDQRNAVKGRNFEVGKFMVPAGNTILKHARQIYIKEISTIKLSGQAKSVFTDGNDVVMATSKVGKGTVFAVGDPWLYNEYINGLKLPAEYENFKAAQDMATWILEQAKK